MNQEPQPSTLPHLDILLILCVLGLIILGIAFIYSSGVTSEGEQVSNEWIKQVIWSVTGILLMFFFAVLDYQSWHSLSLILYVGLILFLILVLLAGSYIKGARSWLGFGRIGIQPSEFGKLVVILFLARWFAEQGKGSNNLRLSLGAILIAGIPICLILLQPDLGTAIVYLPILITIAFFAGIHWKYLLFPLIVGLLVILGVLGFAWNEHIAQTPVSLFRLFTDTKIIKIVFPALLLLGGLLLFGWYFFHRYYFLGIFYILSILLVSYLGIVGSIRVLQGYQMMRLVVFLNPQIDPRGAGWHIIQSVTAVGSGGMYGKGFLQGTQSHYRYLPEQSTDFIFSIIAEEMGFAGGILLFTLFSVIIIRSLYIAYNATDRFGTYIAVGISAMLTFHIIQNIGMAIGIMPITGIPLFFLSYGGSSLWTALMGMGLLLSIHAHRS